ncbi:MAG: hypothetical protein CM15mV10_1560 [uncultured marine virus]|nr:MAG: hypothetical protein CM15mV10_1560 [uncultured marine virus]
MNEEMMTTGQEVLAVVLMPGPVAGFDPVMKFRKRWQSERRSKKIMK